MQVTGEPIAAPALAAWTYLADFVHSLEATTKDEGHARSATGQALGQLAMPASCLTVTDSYPCTCRLASVGT